MTNMMANAVKLANSPQAPKCQGWDPDDSAGCWMHDGPRAAGIDYCEGFRLFVEFDEAMEYGADVEGTFTLGFDPEVQRWAVTPLGDGTYGS